MLKILTFSIVAKISVLMRIDNGHIGLANKNLYNLFNLIKFLKLNENNLF